MSWVADTRQANTEKNFVVAIATKRYEISVVRFQASRTLQRYALMMGWRRLWIKCLYGLVGGNT